MPKKAQLLFLGYWAGALAHTRSKVKVERSENEPFQNTIHESVIKIESARASF